MSIVTKSIVNADAEARYLSPGELDRIKSFVSGGAARLRIAQVLTDNRERIVKQAGDQLFQKRPDVVSPGGNAYGQEMTATCLRDLGLEGSTDLPSSRAGICARLRQGEAERLLLHPRDHGLHGEETAWVSLE
ncbi:MAG: hypothetical protein ACKO5O_00945, partial [Cylindrospermopsis raciborskii]